MYSQAKPNDTSSPQILNRIIDKATLRHNSFTEAQLEPERWKQKNVFLSDPNLMHLQEESEIISRTYAKTWKIWCKVRQPKTRPLKKAEESIILKSERNVFERSEIVRSTYAKIWTIWWKVWQPKLQQQQQGGEPATLSLVERPWNRPALATPGNICSSRAVCTEYVQCL